MAHPEHPLGEIRTRQHIIRMGRPRGYSLETPGSDFCATPAANAQLLNRCHNHKPKTDLAELHCDDLLAHQHINGRVPQRRWFDFRGSTKANSRLFVVSGSPILPPIPPSWKSLLKVEMCKPYYLCAL